MPVVFVTVGTDHHPFTRLMRWSERLASTHPHIDVVVQHGASPRPSGVEAHEMLGAIDLLAQFKSADAVVTHGGPGTILEARAAGHRPIVVPREAAHGEHVDDHQVRFTRRLAADRMIILARQELEVFTGIEQSLRTGRLTVLDDSVAGDAVERFATLVADLVDTRRRRGTRRKRPWVAMPYDQAAAKSLTT
jgi:UDP-N-acetylglucosamine transferase subunit ALG13